ncbi:MAG TPA: PIN domain protein [Candidatus Hydrogenedentes bacterium]|nr:PIN domain protein [Candidatus Hydrogenedentota bacterium]HRT20496.1 PIN domain protein [Candidatus Hydrogenedentota bacterium]HRT65169.1 PIN domain protein [Candidatus Hydrogenedentota bacterium]
MKRLLIYVDASVVGGCEDEEFAEGSLALWRCFQEGRYEMALSDLTLKELEPAPERVRKRIDEIPTSLVVRVPASTEASELAEEYLRHGVVGPGSRADANHVALATIANADILVSWNFKHIVNVGRIRQFQVVNLISGYRTPDIRTPLEVLDYGKEL